jgi:hypothetical protein
MNDAELFLHLTKRIPLRPFSNDTEYFAACELQTELLTTASDDAVARLYLEMLTLLTTHYEEQPVDSPVLQATS